MSLACEVCSEFHDHNIMTHIYELEAHVELLIERIDELERKVEQLKL